MIPLHLFKFTTRNNVEHKDPEPTKTLNNPKKAYQGEAKPTKYANEIKENDNNSNEGGYRKNYNEFIKRQRPGIPWNFFPTRTSTRTVVVTRTVFARTTVTPTARRTITSNITVRNWITPTVQYTRTYTVNAWFTITPTARYTSTITIRRNIYQMSTITAFRTIMENTVMTSTQTTTEMATDTTTSTSTFVDISTSSDTTTVTETSTSTEVSTETSVTTEVSTSTDLRTDTSTTTVEETDTSTVTSTVVETSTSTSLDVDTSTTITWETDTSTTITWETDTSTTLEWQTDTSTTTTWNTDTSTTTAWETDTSTTLEWQTDTSTTTTWNTDTSTTTTWETDTSTTLEWQTDTSTTVEWETNTSTTTTWKTDTSTTVGWETATSTTISWTTDISTTIGWVTATSTTISWTTDISTTIGWLRTDISDVDEQIVKLLNKRAELSIELGVSKKNSEQAHTLAITPKKSDTVGTYVPEQEKVVYSRIKNLNSGPLSDDSLSSIYREIMSSSMSMQEKVLVGYLGPLGTFTHQAARNKFGDSVSYVPLPKIPDVFEAVAKSKVAYGVVPIENSLFGYVTASLDSFIDQATNSSIYILSEVYLPLQQSLLSNTELSKIQKIYSHPMAFGQAQPWIQKHLPDAKQVEVSSTAFGAQLASSEKYSAGIANSLCSSLYDIKVLEQDISTRSDNTTRFLVISNSKNFSNIKEANKLSILVSIKKSIPNGMYNVMSIFNKYKLSTVSINSRPCPTEEPTNDFQGKHENKNWKYTYFIDAQLLDGSNIILGLQSFVQELLEYCYIVKLLGLYFNEVK
ncbi:hypothetical protein BB560_000255 [Smittium megazygosporum]|uniref:Prephenate dehydratase n=1 Tax=Smittium megazygosporum TaxID=133381 RepID=A0A2T9ZKW4_9FUNG|nr:hypothetical protein BB560_000255 [Smittium megazygosporum]